VYMYNCYGDCSPECHYMDKNGECMAIFYDDTRYVSVDEKHTIDYNETEDQPNLQSFY